MSLTTNKFYCSSNPLWPSPSTHNQVFISLSISSSISHHFYFTSKFQLYYLFLKFWKINVELLKNWDECRRIVNVKIQSHKPLFYSTHLKSKRKFPWSFHSRLHFVPHSSNGGDTTVCFCLEIIFLFFIFIELWHLRLFV